MVLIVFLRPDEAKRMIKKVVFIALVIVASLLVAGCTFPISTSSPTPTPTPTPTATPTPVVDFSSVLTSKVESGNFIMTRSFTKSTNIQGHDVYKGVGRNATLSGSKEVTLVFELTDTKTEAKQVYDKIVATKLNEGYTLNPTVSAAKKAQSPNWVEVWYGTSGSN
jgi:hypothetical protein